MADPAARLVLGTAQLGMAYGIANRTGRPSRKAADALLALAWREGLAYLDTAQAYGDSEAVIGDFLDRHPDCPLRVVSKLQPSLAGAPEDTIVAAVAASADRLGGRLAAMLLHDASSLENWETGPGRALRRCRDEGIVPAIGISVYRTEDFRRATTLDGIGLIQAPFNALDRALDRDGLLDRAIEKGIELHLRSVFLQGLLLLDIDTLAAGMGFAADNIAVWRALCRRHGRAPEEAALLFAAQAVPAAFLVIGCETPNQLAANIAYLRGLPLDAACFEDIIALPPANERTIRPDLWN